MSDSLPPTFTHFSSTGSELPVQYYTAMGRALYRWSQLETTVCALAASIQGPSWLEAVKNLRGPHGFKVKNVFQKLKAAARKRAASEPTLADLDRAEKLYSARKILFHSVWGTSAVPSMQTLASKSGPTSRTTISSTLNLRKSRHSLRSVRLHRKV
jgi:hypothetical protein